MKTRLATKAETAPAVSRSAQNNLTPAAPSSSQPSSRSREDSVGSGSPEIPLRLVPGCGGRRRRAPQLWTIRDQVQADGRRSISLSRAGRPWPARSKRYREWLIQAQRLIFVSPQPGRWIRVG